MLDKYTMFVVYIVSLGGDIFVVPVVCLVLVALLTFSVFQHSVDNSVPNLLVQVTPSIFGAMSRALLCFPSSGPMVWPSSFCKRRSARHNGIMRKLWSCMCTHAMREPSSCARTVPMEGLFNGCSWMNPWVTSC